MIFAIHLNPDMKYFLIPFLSLFLIACNVTAQEQVSSFPPSARPDRIVLNLKGDPAVSMALTWRTDTSVTESVARIARNQPGIFLPDSSVSVNGTYTDITGDGNVSRYHSVYFTGLTPGTQYAYCAGSGPAASEWFTFTTAAASPRPFTFLYLGDSQGSISLYSRVIRQAYRSVPDAAFMVFTGDLVDGGAGSKLHDDEWGEWYRAAGFITAEVPLLATPGNHEYINPADRQKRVLNRYWRPGFTLPENGPADLEETAYSVDYEGLRIIALNSNEMMRDTGYAQAQAKWVEELLINNPCKWTVMIFHHPVYSTSASRDNRTLRELLKPLFDRYGVDLVLTGHDHTYARGTGMPEGQEHGGKGDGTVYVVSVSGAKQYRQDAQKWWDVGLTNTQTWQSVRVNGNELEYTSFDAAGNTVDKLVISKKNNGSKRTIKSTGK